MATFEIKNVTSRKEYGYSDTELGLEAAGIAEYNGDGLRQVSGSVYTTAAGGTKAYCGAYSVTRQPDGTLRGSYTPQTDEDLDTLRDVKQAVVARLENENSDNETTGEE